MSQEDPSPRGAQGPAGSGIAFAPRGGLAAGRGAERRPPLAVASPAANVLGVSGAR